MNPAKKEGQFCGVFVYKNHVQLGLANGATPKDINQILLGGQFNFVSVI